jgi:cytoskeleton protein RodZ
MGQPLQIDEHRTRLRVGTQVLPRNRPYVCCEDVVSLLGELSPKQRACRPLGAKKHDVGTCRHNGIPGGKIAATPVLLWATVSRMQESNQCESGLWFQSNLDSLHVMQAGGALMDMGETLRMAREQQGLSLDVISKRTKINTEKLQAIEENDIQRLPSGIFLRGFLRAYAREVGLDVEDTVNRYLAQFESQAPIAEDEAPYATAEETPEEISETQRIEESLREMSMWGVLAIVVLSLGLLAYMTLRSPRVSPAPAVARAEALPTVAPPSAFEIPVPTAPSLPPFNAVPPPPPSENASAVTVAPESATTVTPPSTPVSTVTRSVPEETGTSGVQQPPVAQGSNTIELTIETVGPCWVEAIVDGQTVIYAMMQEGERQTIERGSDVVLRVGDPAAFKYSINGVAGKAIGQPGTASSAHITAENYQEFIAEPTP